MHDGVDGESLLWAADRLARRNERTKLIIYLTDSQPSCSRGEDVSAPPFGHESEIRKHLWLVAKMIEQTGNINLHGVGVCTNAAKDFFKNHHRIDNVQDIPKVLTEIIKDVIAEKGLF